MLIIVADFRGCNDKAYLRAERRRDVLYICLLDKFHNITLLVAYIFALKCVGKQISNSVLKESRFK